MGSPTKVHLCPVAGIGASVGGLEALKKLLQRCQPTLARHLSSFRTEIPPTRFSWGSCWQACNRLPVSETVSGAVFEPNHVLCAHNRVDASIGSNWPPSSFSKPRPTYQKASARQPHRFTDPDLRSLPARHR